MSDGFLGRWSRRKVDTRDGKPVEAEPPVPAAVPVTQESAAAPENKPTEPPPPTLEDVQALTPQSDFTRFVGADVAPEVKNAALRKLFSDPHFNVMDRLDTYIDDYSKPDPMPASMLRKLVSGQFLKLFDDEEGQEEKQEKSPEGREVAPREVADSPSAQTVAQSGSAVQAVPPPAATDADPDLRLQQDHAPGPPGPGQGSP